MSNAVLVITLGNRDLQFDRSIEGLQVYETKKDWFFPNNDDRSKFVINTRGNPSFFEISKKLFAEYDLWNNYAVYPMIEENLKYFKEKKGSFPDNIILVATNQTPADIQDTFWTAKFLQKLLAQQYSINVEIKEFSFPPTDLKFLLPFFIELYKQLHNQFKEIFVGHSGGTPAMRTATILASLSDNFVREFLSVEARSKGIITENAQFFIHKVIQHTLDKMLSVYDYAGILNLPVSNEVKNIAEEALAVYNMNKKFDLSEENNSKLSYDERAIKAIALLIDNMRVTYIQKRYAETLQRIFRLEEAVWYLLFYLYLKEKGFLTGENLNKVRKEKIGSSKHKKFEEIINFGHPNFKKYMKNLFSDLLEVKENNSLVIIYNDQHIPIQGKNFYYFLFKKLNKYTALTDFFAKINKNERGEIYKSNSKLNSIRNHSFLGHGMDGVTKEELDQVVSEVVPENIDKDRFLVFIGKLNDILCSEIQNYEPVKIFDEYNKKIIEKFME